MDQLVTSSPYMMINRAQVLYTKLFFVLGLLWGLDGLHAVINEGAEFETDSIAYYLFKGAEILNLLRGFFMFVIFVCKRSVWRKVRTWWEARLRLKAEPGGRTHLRLLALNSQTSRTLVSRSKSSGSATSARGAGHT